MWIEDGAYAVDYKIKRVIYHPQYNRRTKQNDIALIELANNVTYNNSTRPACLNQFNDYKAEVVAVSALSLFLSVIFLTSFLTRLVGN